MRIAGIAMRTNNSAANPSAFNIPEALTTVACACVRPLQALIAAPSLLFLITFMVIMFRPPNVGLFPWDRVVFLLLTSVIVLRTLLLRNRIPFVFSLTLPMLGLSALALAGNSTRPFDTEAWSLVAAKFLVPYAMFHLAMLVFTSDSAVRKLEVFSVVPLAYLSFISVAFVTGAHHLIFPRFILDGGVELHADRARGPFLQAVANGISLNLLGLCALDLYLRRRLHAGLAIPLLLSLPVAIFATMTRSVWLSFVLSFAAVTFLTRLSRLRCASLYVAIGVAMSVSATIASCALRTAFQDRFANRQTVEFRIAVYQLSWDLLREKPLLGWGHGQLAREIETRISGYRPESYAAHNTFIEVLVEHGVLGFSLYIWMAVGLFRLGKNAKWFRSTWPVFLGVYFLNACFVVMNYQFVNALVFTFAGVLAYQNRCSRVSNECTR